MQELNNLQIVKLPQVLKKETLMEGYWHLVSDAELNCEKLHKAGIVTSTDLLDIVANPTAMEKLLKETGIPKSYIHLLDALLFHHCFKAISLKKIEDIPPDYLNSLEAKGIKNTGAMLLAGKTKFERAKLAGETKIPEELLAKITGMADLMRKPGIKTTKVKLYLAAGVNCLEELGKRDPQTLRAILIDLVDTTRIVKTVPVRREVESDICWARLYPRVIDL